MGSKQIFHLEAFVAKYMRLYERYAGCYLTSRSLLTSAAIRWALTLTRHDGGVYDKVEALIRQGNSLINVYVHAARASGVEVGTC